LPLVTITNDNLEPRLVAGLTGKQPYVNFTLEGDQKLTEQIELLQAWFNNELENGVKIEPFTQAMIHKLLLDGTVYPIARYEIDEVIRRDFVFDNQGNITIDEQTRAPQIADTKDTAFEGGRIEMVSFNDVYVPDNVDDWEKAPVIRKVYPTYAELQRDKDKLGYMNIGEWLIKEESDKNLSDGQQSPVQKEAGAKYTGKEIIECIECSVSYIYQGETEEKEDIKDFIEERLVVQIAIEKQTIIRMVLLRDLNFKNEHLVKRVRLFPEEGLSYGTTIYGKMRSIQDGASRTFRGVMNSADVAMIPWFFFTDKAGLKGDISLYPGKGVKCDDTKSILFPNFSVNPSQFIEFIFMWSQFWERLMSIGDLQVGRSKDTGKQTATETMAVIQEGNVKHNYQAKTFREEYLTVIRTLYDLYYKNMPLDKKFLYNGQMVPISRREMSRAIKFRLTGATEMSNKLIERKENEDMFKMTVNDPLIDAIKIRKDLLKSYNRTNTDEYINPEFNQVYQIMAKFPQIKPVIFKAIQQAMQMAKGVAGEPQRPDNQPGL